MLEDKKEEKTTDCKDACENMFSPGAFGRKEESILDQLGFMHNETQGRNPIVEALLFDLD